MIGKAYFPEYGLSLSVHDFRAGVGRGDTRYRASLAITHVAKFTAAFERGRLRCFWDKGQSRPRGRHTLQCYGS